MLSLVRKRCFRKSYWAGIERNISKNTILSNNDVSCNNKNDLKWTKAPSLQVKKFQSSAVDKEELNKFMAVYPDIVNDLTAFENGLIHSDITEWLSEVIKYNVPNGNKYRAMILMLTYRMMTEPENQTPENTRLAMILGWSVEMFLASFLVADDLIDRSEMRRGIPCWYKRKCDDLIAVNDSFFLLSSAYALVRKHFQDKPYINNIMDIFTGVLMQTVVGQSSELNGTSSNAPKLELFTKERYKNLAVHKAAFCTFILPVDLAMCLTANASEMQQAKPIFYDMGYLYQVENDFHDCYGNPTETGKIGKDIEEGKCTWLAVKALQKASSEQRKIMEECYGSTDPQKVAAVKSLYNELDLPNEYSAFKNDILNNILMEIQKIPSERQQNVLLTILEKLQYKLA